MLKRQFKWKTKNLFEDYKKNIYLFGDEYMEWNEKFGSRFGDKISHDKEFNVLKNDKNAIDEATTLSHDIKNNSFLLYLNGVDHNGHKYGFSL